MITISDTGNVNVDGLRVKNNGFLQDDGDNVFLGHNNASSSYSRQWYMNVTDASTNGGNIDLVFNLSDLGLSGNKIFH